MLLEITNHNYAYIINFLSIQWDVKAFNVNVFFFSSKDKSREFLILFTVNKSHKKIKTNNELMLRTLFV